MRTYTEQEAMRALTPTGGFLRGFAYSLNPYIGCAFGAGAGCPFCYVRTLPVAHAHAGRWGAWVIAKTNLPQLLERELAALVRSGKLADATIFMSSATDPYQGVERRLGLTRRALEAFVRHPPRRLVIQTRSPLIERDLDVIGRLRAENRNAPKGAERNALRAMSLMPTPGGRPLRQEESCIAEAKNAAVEDGPVVWPVCPAIAPW
jgi:DNA repair photolyase